MGDPGRRWRRAGDTLARLLALCACLSLGVVLAVAGLSTVWLMTSAKTGFPTQSMSIYTVAAPAWAPILVAGLAGGVVVVLLCWLAWSKGRVLEGRAGLAVLVAGTFALQVAIILALQTRDALWGDGWMIDDFVDVALGQGIPALFKGPYKSIYHDARLYFSCYPFQATFFWLLLWLRQTFGAYGYMVFQLMGALANELAVVSLWAIAGVVGPAARNPAAPGPDEASAPGGQGALTAAGGARRVLWVLLATCLPMYWLSTFIYGNALGFGFACAYLAMQARALWWWRQGPGHNGEAIMWACGSVVPLVLALCVKATFVLVAIAAVLVWVIEAIRRRSAWGVAATLCAFVLARLVSGLPFEALAASSGGYAFGDGLTTLAHLELGLRMGRGEFYVSVDGGEASFAPGGWSDHATGVWAASGENAAIQNRTALWLIGEDVAGFVADPGYAAWFFATKLATEWADPTYQSLYYLSECGDASGSRFANPSDLSRPEGVAAVVLTFMLDGYQTVTFATALGFVVLAWRGGRRGAGGPGLVRRGVARTATPALMAAPVRGRREAPEGACGIDAVTLLLGSVFFTGFGCYLLWEAKSVYVLPFAVMMLPLSAAGAHRLFSAAHEWAERPKTLGTRACR